MAAANPPVRGQPTLSLWLHFGLKARERVSRRARLSCSSTRIERFTRMAMDSTGSLLPARWMTRVPVNSSARSSVAESPRSVRTSQESGMGGILPRVSR